MLADIAAHLVCPLCGSGVTLMSGALRCESGHSFDVAREGYVNLLPGGASGSTADTPAMVAARRAFLEAGHFTPITDAVANAIRDAIGDRVSGVYLDAGAGTGFLLSALLERTPESVGIALDVSKHAIRIAARSHERIGALVADVWEPLPLRDGCAAVVLNVFAPRNAEEFARVIAPGGALIVVTPRAEHLAELVVPLGLISVDPHKRERLAAKLGPHFDHVAERSVSRVAALSRSDAIAAVCMGPSAVHMSADEVATRMRKLADPLSVTLSVAVDTYRPHAPRDSVSPPTSEPQSSS